MVEEELTHETQRRHMLDNLSWVKDFMNSYEKKQETKKKKMEQWLDRLLDACRK